MNCPQSRITSTSIEVIKINTYICSTNDEQMKGLGFLEETILLLVIIMDGDAYGYSISEAYQEHTGKSITLSAIHAVLSRLVWHSV